jgi:hypothetical protein
MMRCIALSVQWGERRISLRRHLSNTMPEVFDPSPEIIAGFLAYKTEHALLRWNPLIRGIVKKRGLLVTGPVETMHAHQQDKSRATWMRRLITFSRAAVFVQSVWSRCSSDGLGNQLQLG